MKNSELPSWDEWKDFSDRLFAAWQETEALGTEAIRELIRVDRYYLLVKVLRRKDLLHPWLYARCREVEAAPDGYIDIWGREHFKALGCESPILTPAGWRLHGSLEPGDEVFSMDGERTQVVARTPNWEGLQCFRVIFTDGTELVAERAHLWLVMEHCRRRDGSRRVARFPAVRSTGYLAELDHDRLGRRGHRIAVPFAKPLDYPAVSLLVPPYTLGAWLGDGTTGRGSIGKPDHQLWEEIQRDGFSITDNHNHTKTVHGLVTSLRQLGVLYRKHIPAQYLAASIEQRRALLQGLMDTDGTCDRHGTATFCSTNEELARGTCELAGSLALHPSLRRHVGSYKGSPYPFFQVSFQAYEEARVFRLTRKQSRTKKGQRWPYRYIGDVQPVVTEPVNCIQVAHKSGLYLAGRDLVPTHNSSIITNGGIIQEVLKDPETTIGIFSHTKPIAKSFLAQIKREFEANDVLRSLFPDILWEDPQRQSPGWSLDGGIIVRRQGNPKEGTIEAHGLVDGQPTSKHFKLLVYDDVVVPESVSTAEQIAKTTEAWSLSDNLGSIGGRKWILGTRYHFCVVGESRILLSNFTHKPIEEISAGDEVVGWELRDGKRWLRPSKVIRAGMHPDRRVNRYTLEGGRSVICTEDHRWWRGAHGGGAEYAPLGLPIGTRKDRPPKGLRSNGMIVALRELLVPCEPSSERELGWLAGMFDGEGTVRKNTYHPSGTVVITQSMAHPELIDAIRESLTEAGFDFSESWHSPSGIEGQENWNDRCNFSISGGWRERYRFLAEVAPKRTDKLIASLYGQLHTQKRRLEKVEDAGQSDVFWLETETGNYIAEGFCSKNSDTYSEIMKRGAAIPRIYPATDDGTPDGKPVLFPQAVWDQKKRDQLEATIATQMLANPLAGKQRMFDVNDLQSYEVRPLTLMAYLLIDPARSVKKDSANTAMVVLGVDAGGNKYLLDGVDHKMDLMERWRWMRDLWFTWRQSTGIVGVHVGYERFGAIADLDYFRERQRIENMRFEIEELEWPREGEGSKKDRVQRLVPDIRGHRFYLPYPTDDNRLTSLQQRMVSQGYEYRLAQRIRRVDENGQLYDLTDRFRLQVSYFPFGGLKDLLDAASRLYDIDPVTPTVVDETYLEPEWV